MEYLTLPTDRRCEAAALLSELRERGATVRLIHPATIEVEGKGAKALIPRVRALKPALIEYLSHPPTWPCARCGNFAFQEPEVTCLWCRSGREVTA